MKNEKEYKIKKGWAIFMFITAPLLLALFTLPYFFVEIPIFGLYFFLPMSIIMVFLISIGLLDIIYGKIIISSNKISIRTTIINRDLKISEIKGFRIAGQYIFIVPNTTSKKRIKIEYAYLSNSKEILLWLYTNSQDLDQIHIKDEKKKILENLEYGGTVIERKDKLKKAKRTSKLLNWLGGLITGWTIFKPIPYEFAILASIIIPITAVLAVFYYKGLIKIKEKEGAYPNIAIAILFPPMVLFLRSLLDFEIYDYNTIWKPLVIVTITFTLLLLIGTKEFKLQKIKHYFALIPIILIMTIYSYGSIITLNGIYDISQSKTFQAKILNKRISTGKTTSYYIKLTPWNTQVQPKETTVTSDLYYNSEINNEVTIHYNEGLFHIPWFIVTKQ